MVRSGWNAQLLEPVAGQACAAAHGDQQFVKLHRKLLADCADCAVRGGCTGGPLAPATVRITSVLTAPTRAQRSAWWPVSTLHAVGLQRLRLPGQIPPRPRAP